MGVTQGVAWGFLSATVWRSIVWNMYRSTSSTMLLMVLMVETQACFVSLRDGMFLWWENKRILVWTIWIIVKNGKIVFFSRRESWYMFSLYSCSYQPIVSSRLRFFTKTFIEKGKDVFTKYKWFCKLNSKRIGKRQVVSKRLKSPTTPLPFHIAPGAKLKQYIITWLVHTIPRVPLRKQT